MDKKNSISFTINKRLPGMNDILAAAKQTGKGIAYSKMKKHIGEFIAYEIRTHGANKTEIEEPIAIKITWFEKTKRRDPDNISAGVKFILDAMVKERVIKTDGWKSSYGWHIL